MTITEAWQKFFDEHKKLRSHDYYDASSGINIPSALVTAEFTRPDSMGNEINPGDIVALDKGGKYAGILVGILLGYTKQGYRVAAWNTGIKEEYRTLKGGIHTPHQVFLVKRMGSTII